MFTLIVTSGAFLVSLISIGLVGLLSYRLKQAEARFDEAKQVLVSSLVGQTRVNEALLHQDAILAGQCELALGHIDRLVQRDYLNLIDQHPTGVMQ